MRGQRANAASAPLSRRSVLGGLGGAALSGIGACGTSAAGAAPVLHPVLSSVDREIRTVAGLRPYRPEGFVTHRERLGRKWLVHNYGHGGAGVTLSWGTALLALQEARDTGETVFAVLGAGVSGLTIGVLLAQRGAQVTIYARDLPPETTSNIAGAYWYPSSVFDGNKASAAFKARFDSVTAESFRRFSHYANDARYGVSWVPHYILRRMAPGRLDLPGGNGLYPELEVLSGGRAPRGFDHAVRHYSMVIDPDIYLRALLDDFYAAGGRVVQRGFSAPGDVAALGEPVIVNCTGLGARRLFGDTGLYPIKGQLTYLLPQPEIDYAYGASLPGFGPLYMFPRKTSIVLGGSYQRQIWTTLPDPDERARMVAGHAAVAERLTGRGRLFGGFRP